MRSRAALLLIVVLSLLSGCAHQRKQVKEPDLRPIVGRVQLDGTSALKPVQIRGHLGQRQTHSLHWIPVLNFVYPAVRLDGDTWEDDKTRIANIYALHGYFDARVIASQVVVRATRKKDGSASRVRVVHQIEEGEPSAVANITVNAPEGLMEVLTDGLPLVVGETFTMDAVEDSEKLMRGRLASLAYARARVTSRVDAYPETHTVDVTFDVERGAPARFGEISIEGLTTIREKYVQRHIRIVEGEPWDGRKVAQTQQAIYNMGVFALVTVSPDMEADLEPDADGVEVVPVKISLKERKPRTFTGGAGVSFTIDSVAITGRAELEHVNSFRRLVHFKMLLMGGPKLASPAIEDFGPVLDFDVSLRWPDFPVRTVDLFVAGGFEMDVERGYKYLQPEGEFGVVWSLWRPLKLSATYSVLYFKLYDDRLDQVDTSEVTATTFDDGYLLTMLSPQLILDLRDNLLAPNKGFYFSATVDAALPPGQYNYVRTVGDVRGYVPLGTPRIVAAGRLTGSYIHLFGETTQIPIDEAVYAGGDGSVRGWKPRYLGPRTVEKDCTRVDCILPLGGRVGFTGSVEIRGNPVGGLWLAGFTDFGRVWAEPEDIASAEQFFEELQFSVGGGIRYNLSIGRIRLDFAIHPKPWTDDVFRDEVIKPLYCAGLDTDECPQDLWREPFNWNIHFGIGESF
ncbi:MAG: BamA/TamA family outer membrane protein [Proteobacteria bacterium]|nr:BamA/TamA family outer membrane protein [Pseudomonadota bacterium]